MIQNALKLTNNRMEEAAQLLGLSRKGLYLKRQRLGIDLQDTSATAATGRRRRRQIAHRIVMRLNGGT